MYLLLKSVSALKSIKRFGSTIVSPPPATIVFPPTTMGVNIGMANSHVTIMKEKKPQSFAVPPFVAFNQQGELLFGDDAAKQGNLKNPFHTIAHLIEMKFDDPIVRNIRNIVPFKIVEASNGYTCIESAGKVFTPLGICAYSLEKMKKEVEKAWSEPNIPAVIAIPSFLNGSQHSKVKKAAEIAEMNIIDVTTDHKAAALACFLQYEENKSIAVCDFDNGAMNISVIKMERGIFKFHLVYAGNYIDNLFKHLASQFGQQNNFQSTDELSPREISAFKKALVETKNKHQARDVFLVGKADDQVKQVAKLVFDKDPVIVDNVEAVSFGAALHCDLILQQFSTKEFVEHSLQAARDNLFPKPPDTVRAIWSSVSRRIKAFYAVMGIDVRTVNASRILTQFASSFAADEREKTVIRVGFDNVQFVNHRHYSRGLPEELVQSVIDCVPDFIEAYQDLEAYNDKIYQGIKPYFKKAEEKAIEVEKALLKAKTLMDKIGRNKRYFIKDENELKGLQLKIVPPFYEIIDGIPYLQGIASLTKSVQQTLNSYEVRKLGDKVQGYVMNFTETEQKAREATNEDPWGPTGPEMQEIASLTFQYDQFTDYRPPFVKQIVFQVTPSSKIVGDLARFMVQNKLTLETLAEKVEELSFPKSVVEFLQKKIDGHPGEGMPPMDLEKKNKELEEKRGRNLREVDVMSSAMFPREFDDFEQFRQTYGPVDKLETLVFLVGPNVADEVNRLKLKKERI
uniref:Uncharacterized protein n=1 Tax=Meloidogyne javanica TaxID=6303 RepID=A0A915M456_MELJA